MTPGEMLIVSALGLAAGIAGGLLGIGGSVLIIPGLTVLMGTNQHLYQAAAMVVNAVVAVAALPRHLRGGSVRREVFLRMLPAGVIAMLCGVAVSDQLEAIMLQRLFALFLIWFGASEIYMMIRRGDRTETPPERTGWLTCSVIGIIMGFLAGLLGIGGGVVVVPLLRRITRMPLRHCIGTTTAVMLVTATIGAASKNYTLSGHLSAIGEPLTLSDSAALVIVLVPAGIVGAFIGSHLNYRIPLRGLRLALVLLLLLAAARMLGLPNFA